MMPKGVYIHKKGRVITWGDKISESSKGKVFSESHKKALSVSHLGMLSGNKGKKGYHHTVEAKKKIGESSIGNVYMLGRKLSEETKEKIGIASRGRKHTELTKEKIRAAQLGIKRPELTGNKNPMHTHPNSYKSRFGKCGYREDIGIFVRSRWEANIYRIYTYLGYTLQYEPRSFKLSDGRTYRPDFYVKELNLWIEVKGRWLKDARDRFNLFKKDYSSVQIQVIGPCEYKELYDLYSTKLILER